MYEYPGQIVRYRRVDLSTMDDGFNCVVDLAGLPEAPPLLVLDALGLPYYYDTSGNVCALNQGLCTSDGADVCPPGAEFAADEAAGKAVVDCGMGTFPSCPATAGRKGNLSMRASKVDPGVFYMVYNGLESGTSWEAASRPRWTQPLPAPVSARGWTSATPSTAPQASRPVRPNVLAVACSG